MTINDTICEFVLHVIALKFDFSQTVWKLSDIDHRKNDWIFIDRSSDAMKMFV